MDTIAAVCVGVGLSAACGLRVFIPMLLMSLSAKLGFLHLAHGFEWLATWTSVMAFGVATVLEVTGSAIPWFDHAVDAMAAPAAIAAGTLATMAQLGDAGPLISWSAGLSAGGLVAGGVHLAGAGTRVLSTTTTGGAANPILSAAQGVSATILSVLSIVTPILAGLLVLAMGYGLWRIVRSRRAARARRVSVDARRVAPTVVASYHPA